MQRGAPPGKSVPQGQQVRLRRVLRDRTWALLGVGLAEAAVAQLLGWGQAAQGVLVGVPAGLLNHWVMRFAVGRWQAGGCGAAWVMGASALRLLLAGALLWWAASRSEAFLVGALFGLLVEMLDYTFRLPLLIRRLGRR